MQRFLPWPQSERSGFTSRLREKDSDRLSHYCGKFIILVCKLAGGLRAEQLGNLAHSWIQLKKICVVSTVGGWPRPRNAVTAGDTPVASSGRRALRDAERPKSLHYCLRGDRHFKRVSVYPRLPVKLVKKRLWLVHSMGCWEDVTLLSGFFLWLVRCWTFRRALSN